MQLSPQCCIADEIKLYCLTNLDDEAKKLGVSKLCMGLDGILVKFLYAPWLVCFTPIFLYKLSKFSLISSIHISQTLSIHQFTSTSIKRFNHQNATENGVCVN